MHSNALNPVAVKLCWPCCFVGAWDHLAARQKLLAVNACSCRVMC